MVITNAPTAASNAATYALTYASGLSSTNYTINPASTSVNYTVNPAILNLAISKTYNSDAGFNKDNTYTITGTRYNSDALPTITGGSAATSSPNAATYNSFISNTLALSNANYTLVGGTVAATIDKANAYVIIGSGQSSTYGSTPTINYSYYSTATGSGGAVVDPSVGLANSGM
ncbi:hypothetical protein, partial [Polynucleobacter asymbioticus]|uniref:hypothetical protein n=1 Tax=Polynucleobacter asymbioticus TaxID=576611 RepID=UPI000B225CBD